MKITYFLKDKLFTTILLLFGIATIEIFLLVYSFANFMKLYIPIIILSCYGIGLTIEYRIRKNFYQNLFHTLNELEDKYLIAEIINSPDFTEGKILKDVLEQVNKCMIERVNQYKYRRRRL